MVDWKPDDDAWRPDGDDPEHDDDEDAAPRAPTEVRLVTPTPVPLRVTLLDRDDVPAGERAFATYLALEGAPDRPIAVNSLPESVLMSLLGAGMFEEPRHLAAVLREEEGGVRGLLQALIPADQLEQWARAHEGEEGAPEEPWKASLPKAPSFEEQLAADDEDEEDEEDDDADGDRETIAMVPFALGVILRFPENRRHRDDFVQEAIDLFATVLGGQGTDAKEKRIDNLLDGL
jgi:hypothetical protein